MSMDFLHIDLSASLCTEGELLASLKKLEPEIARLKQAFTQQYDSIYASVYVPFDVAYHAKVQALIDEKKQLLATCLFVIGIGGSNLGILAIHEALHGILYNDLDPALKMYCADTVDAQYLKSLLIIAQHELEKGNRILINVITKSGTTTETIVNFELFLSLLQQYHPDDYQKYIVITTDEDSVLWDYAQKNHCALLPIPKKVGGRFSVLSAVGLFPLGMLKVPIYDLLAGAGSVKEMATGIIEYNAVAHSAATIFAQYKKGIIIQDMFVFSHELRSMGAWYRQLMGESIGKEHDIHGAVVERGINPTVSVGTVDLHSVGQLYLGGPRDKCNTFVSVRPEKNSLMVPDLPEFGHLVANIQGKSVPYIMQAIIDGVKAAYRKQKRPFISIEFPALNAWYCGQFLQFKMIEMMFLGFLLEVDPFDQPNVESYKQETRNLLAQ
jgi:glucose-6-phosphate isomerase